MNDEIMKAAGFGDAVDAKHLGICPFCGREIQASEFRNELSKREYKISGLCQKCQDDFFGT